MITKMNPLVSIVTVCYNSVTDIEKTINSVLNQTYSNIEYIIIDGGSTDGTVDIIKRYSGRVSYWISEPDKGIYDAMNKAIQLAKGEWVNFMNSGDVFYNNDVLAKVFTDTDLKNFGVIYGTTNNIYSNFQKIIIPKQLSNKNYMPFCHQSSFVKSYLLRKHLFDLNYKICADRNLFYQLYNEGIRFYFVELVVASYEAEKGFSSMNFPKILREIAFIEGKQNSILYRLYSYMLIFRWYLGKCFSSY